MSIFLGILILVTAVFLVVAVLMQSGSNKRLSGTISGAAETFFGKNKGKTVDRILGKVTNVVAVVFALLVLASFLYVNKAPKTNDDAASGETTTTAAIVTTTTAAGESADTTTAASIATTTESAAE